jgi:hypothetical protein
VSHEGRVFEQVRESLAAPTGVPIVIGVDWARLHDYTCFMLLSSTGCVLALDRFRGMGYDAQLERLITLATSQQVKGIVAEQNNMGDVLYERLSTDPRLEKAGIIVRPFQTTGSSKQAAIERLKVAFEKGAIHIASDLADRDVLIGELMAFEGRRSESGAIKYGAPSGFHDDTVMSLAIAYSDLETIQQDSLCEWDADSLRDLNRGLTKESYWNMDEHFRERGSPDRRENPVSDIDLGHYGFGGITKWPN